MKDFRITGTEADQSRHIPVSPRPGRIVHLEAARGIASIIVVLHHFTSAFWPRLLTEPAEGGLRGTPAFLLINGNAAVLFFFVLSGFVLSLRFLDRPDPPFRGLAGAALKRLPRLAVPAGASILIGYGVLVGLTPAYIEAARISDSSWLGNFGGMDPLSFSPNLADALISIPLTFLMPDFADYNANLWTMFYEFWGSIVVYALLLVLLLAKRRLPPLAQHLYLAAVGLLLMARIPLVASFVFGLLLASLYASRPSSLHLGKSLQLLLILVVLLTSMGGDARLLAISAFATMLLLLQPGWTIGPLSGTVGRWLGKLSFPLYLVHSLVILSVSSRVFVALHDAANGVHVTLAVTFAVTLAASLVASLPFVWLEDWWLPRLNRMMRRLRMSNSQ